MIVKKTYTKIYEIIDCSKWNGTLGETKKRAQELGVHEHDIDKCFVCEHKFTDDDYPYLAIFKGRKNDFICEECAKKVKSGQDQEINVQETVIGNRTHREKNR